MIEEKDLQIISPSVRSASYSLLRSVIRLGLLGSIALITLLSVLASLGLSFAYYYFWGGGVDQVTETSWWITAITPLIIAPAVSASLMHLLIELDKARNLAHTLAITDVLTGTFNRRYFMSLGQREFLKAKINKSSLALIMIDVDNFKKVNDIYGHENGDIVLKNICKAVTACLRGTDVLARLGGEEFVVLLPQTGMVAAEQVAERFRHAVAAMRIDSGRGSDFSITISLGVSCFDAGNLDLTQLLRQADEALYRAKGGGRNQTVLSM